MSAHDLAMHDMLREDLVMPDPEAYASQLLSFQTEVAQVIVGAAKRNVPGYGTLYMVDRSWCPELRSMGLVPIGDEHLGGFGLSVRKALIAQLNDM